MKPKITLIPKPDPNITKFRKYNGKTLCSGIMVGDLLDGMMDEILAAILSDSRLRQKLLVLIQASADDSPGG